MEIILPSDCGNAPRAVIVGEFAVNWAKGDIEAIDEWLAEDASWSLLGGETHRGDGLAAAVRPPISPERVEVLSIVTHGRLASCDGYVEAGNAQVGFSHVFRFANTSKRAKVAELRTYCVEAAGRDVD